MNAGLAFASLYFGHFHVWNETTGHDIKRHLIDLGLKPSGIPVTVGGDWRYESFNRWCRDQIVLELEPHTSKRPPMAAAARNVSRRSTAVLENTTSASQGDDEGVEENKRDRVRRLNTIHSRQKRERRKAEQGELESEYRNLRYRNTTLRAENKLLESLWLQAQNAVQQFFQFSKPAH